MYARNLLGWLETRLARNTLNYINIYQLFFPPCNLIQFQVIECISSQPSLQPAQQIPHMHSNRPSIKSFARANPQTGQLAPPAATTTFRGWWITGVYLCYYSTVYSITLYCIILYYSIVQYSIVQYIIIQHRILYYIILYSSIFY